MKKTLSIALSLLSITAFAQEDAISAFDIQTDLDAANEHFSGLATFSLDKKDRLIIVLSDGGNTYRTDMAYVEELAPELFAFEENTNYLVLKCVGSVPKCVSKEITKTGAISATGRSTIPIPGGDSQGREAIALVAKLVRDKQRMQHDEANVTQRPEPRKK